MYKEGFMRYGRVAIFIAISLMCTLTAVWGQKLNNELTATAEQKLYLCNKTVCL